VTTQVKRLEEQLGTQLLTRHGRGMILTPAGSSLMERLDLVFGLLNAPFDEPAVSRQTTGTLTLALLPEVAPLIVPRFLTACEARLPGVTLTVQGGVSAALEEWLLDRRADIAVLQDPPALDELEIEPVVTEGLGLITSARDTSLDMTKSVTPRQLMGLRLVLPRSRHWIRRLLDDAAFRHGFPLKHVHEADEVSLIKEMVRYGLGHGVLPQAAVRDEIARGSLSFRPFRTERLETLHAIACRRDAGAMPLIAEVRLILREVMVDLVESGNWAGAEVATLAARKRDQHRLPPAGTARDVVASLPPPVGGR
jgi:LysR family nitrogen assimilation transcriptional regulator